MPTFSFNGHYIDWQKSRLNAVNKYIKSDFFKDKTLLEMGCGHAFIGNEFSKLGAIVTGCDARKEHLDFVNQTYPHIPTFIMDCDKDNIPTKYDIIVHWGLLYHLAEIEKHIHKLSSKCDVLLLETIVVDTDDPSFYINTNEKGADQAYNNIGIRPSPTFVEKILAQNDFNYKIIMDPILNSSFHTYDWTIKNTKMWTHGMRRFWICWKNNVNPLTFMID